VVRLVKSTCSRTLASGSRPTALYATYTWTAAPGLSSLQAARFYVPAIGAISLLGAWLVAQVIARLGHLPRRARALGRVPGRAPLAAVTSAAVVAAMFGLGVWSFNDMRAFSLGGPSGSVRLPGKARQIGGPPGRLGQPPGGPATNRP
jgi:hypothetical protein